MIPGAARVVYNRVMSPPAVLSTIEDLLRLPEKDGVRYELIDGELVEGPLAAYYHEFVKSVFHRLFCDYLRQNPIGLVFSEMMVELGPHEGLIPDVTIVFSDRLPSPDSRKLFQGAPDIAVEVVSSEEANRLQTKIRAYFRAGCKAVLVAYPTHQTIHVCRPDGAVRVLEGEQILELPDLLPGFRAPASQFFRSSSQ